MSPLTSTGEAATVTKSPIAPDIHEAFDVHGNFLAEVTLHTALRVDDFADFADLFFGELFHADVRTDPRLFEDEFGTRVTDSVDMGKSDIDALVTR
jgi:hypothetical protein